MDEQHVPEGSLSRFLLKSLTEEVAEQLLADARAHGPMYPFATATRQFLSLLDLQHRYITLALAEAKGEAPQSVDQFVYNLEFCLRASRDKALSYLPAADRAVGEMRFQRGLALVKGIFTSYASRPIHQIINVKERSMFRGPWVEFIESINGIYHDIGYLIALHPPEVTQLPKKRRKQDKKLLEDKVGTYINQQLDKGTPLERITRDGIAAATGIAKGLVSETGPWANLAIQKSLERRRTLPDRSMLDPAEAAIQKLTAGEVPPEAAWEAIRQAQERDERTPSRSR